MERLPRFVKKAKLVLVVIPGLCVLLVPAIRPGDIALFEADNDLRDPETAIATKLFKFSLCLWIYCRLLAFYITEKEPASATWSSGATWLGRMLGSAWGGCPAPGTNVFLPTMH